MFEIEHGFAHSYCLGVVTLLGACLPRPYGAEFQPEASTFIDDLNS